MKKSCKENGKRDQVVLNERQLSVAGGWIGGAGLGVAGLVEQTPPADAQPQMSSAMDGYIRG